MPQDVFGDFGAGGEVGNGAVGRMERMQAEAEEKLLCNYLNNIAEFSKLNDIDVFDEC